MSWSCVICTDLCDNTRSLSSVPCGHIFHQQCLSKWLSHALTCPSCRRPISTACTTRLYPTIYIANESNEASESNFVAAKAEIRQKDQELSLLRSQNEQLTLFVSKAESDVAKLHQKNLDLQDKYQKSLLRIRDMKNLEAKVQHLESLCTEQSSELQLYQNIKSILSERKQDVDTIVNAECMYAVDSNNMHTTVKKFATYISFLKLEFEKVKHRKDELFVEVQRLKNSNIVVTKRYQKYQRLCEKLQSQINSLTEKEKMDVSSSNQVRNFDNDINPAAGNSLFTKSRDGEQVSVGELCGNFGFGRNSKKIPVIVLDDSEVPTCSASKNEAELPVIRKVENEEGSVTRIGYDGLGGHKSVVIKSGPKLIRRMGVEKKAVKFATIKYHGNSLRRKDM